MTDLAKTWAQGVHDQMIKENELEDEIDLPAPIRRTAFGLENEDTDVESVWSEETGDNSEFFLESETDSETSEETDEDPEFLSICDTNQRVTRSMSNTPKTSPTVKSTGPTTRIQAKVSGSGPIRSKPTPPKVTRT